MAVKIRMKKMGKAHRPFFRICAIDGRSPRNGRVIEELGHYDPMIPDTDARAILKGERIDYWLGVGAQPSDKVKVLIKKYGTNGTHAEKQKEAIERSSQKKRFVPLSVPKPVVKPKAVEVPAEAPVAEAEAASEPETAVAEAPAAETEEKESSE